MGLGHAHQHARSEEATQGLGRLAQGQAKQPGWLPVKADCPRQALLPEAVPHVQQRRVLLFRAEESLSGAAQFLLLPILQSCAAALSDPYLSHHSPASAFLHIVQCSVAHKSWEGQVGRAGQLMHGTLLHRHHGSLAQCAAPCLPGAETAPSGTESQGAQNVPWRSQTVPP